MENTIDRKAYRRNSYNNYEIIEKVEIKRSNNLLLSKIINAMLLLLFILLIKFFYFEEEFNFIKEYFYSGYSFEDIRNFVNEKMANDSFNSENKIVEENENVLIEEIPITSGENEYIEAVEGVNQLLEDAEKIKSNYEIKIPLSGVITSEFGCRVSDNPIVSSYHNGIDIAANTGTNISAAHSGIIIEAGEKGTYGKCLIIESGELTTLYAHCSELLVKKGAYVDVGQNIAKVGMSGNATGPHLHFEIKYNDRVVNPKDVIEIGEK